LSYKEAQDGQILEEGITEAGSLASFTAAGTAYSTLGEAVIPFFIFYSMFGFQRVGDLIWAFGDARGKGFLLGATAGRTTLTGEGLQHCDGHSLILASTVANCKAYDPAFAYEMAVIVRDGIKNMYGTDAKEGFYYLTLYNENIVQPAMPGLGTVSEAEIEEGIIRGIYLYKPEEKVCSNKASILASGSAMGAAIEAQKVLAEEFDVCS
jgi:pyruvate dehydrogenase E1 component